MPPDGSDQSGSKIYAPARHLCRAMPPTGNPDWWDYKRRWFGADDGIEFIEAERLLPLFERHLRATHLNIKLSGTK